MFIRSTKDLFDRFLKPLLVLGIFGFGFSASDAQKSSGQVVGLEELHRIDLMPQFKHSIRIGSVTSYDRSGGNDDGFSGKYSYVRKEGNDLVLAELTGPGCIYRFHTPTPTNDLVQVYFDGETAPRISMPLTKLFSGNVLPFVRPLVDYAGGGYTCYVPIPFQKSCKIVLRAPKFQFYDLNYATYAVGTHVESFNPVVSAKAQQDIQLATRVFNVGGLAGLTQFNVPSGTGLTTHKFSASLKKSRAVTLFETHTPGRIAGFRLEPAEAFAGKARDVMLRVTWDGAKSPSIYCPVGDFFGYAWGRPAMGASLLGTSEGVNYCNIPMPFDRSAKIELVSLGRDIPQAIHGQVVLGDSPRRADEGRFYAVWRRENPTTVGKPFTYVQTKGRGHIVGLALQAQGQDSGNTGFFEGDDVTTVDGQMAIHGTGSEDSFNGGWYDVPDRWDGPVARALSGCMLYQKPLGRTGGYRFFLGDAYAFRKSILQTIEHSGEGNEGLCDYTSVTYLYCDTPPISGPVSPPARQVKDPTKVIFTAHWSLPISSFSFADATVSRHDVAAGKGSERCLSFRARGEDFFGPPFISFLCDLPSAGKYKIYIDAVKGPEQGIVQLFKDETAAGSAVDLFATRPARADELFVGEFKAAEGTNRVMLKLVGKNAAATSLGLDLINLVFVRSE